MWIVCVASCANYSQKLIDRIYTRLFSFTRWICSLGIFHLSFSSFRRSYRLDRCTFQNGWKQSVCRVFLVTFWNIVGLEGEKSDGEEKILGISVFVLWIISFPFNREITMRWTILFSVWKTTSTPSSPCQMNLSWRQWRPLKLPHRPIAIELFTPPWKLAEDSFVWITYA